MINYACISHLWKDNIEIEPNELCIKNCTWKVSFQDKARFEYLLRMAKCCNINWLWMDTLCINQQDEQDKEKEIPRMGKYYKVARAVLLHNSEIESKLIINNNKINCCKLNDNFFDCIWFTRVWTWQEAVLPNNVIIYVKENIYDIKQELKNYYLYDKNRTLSNIINAYNDIDSFNCLAAGNALLRTSKRVCKIKNDRIYAIIGFLGYSGFKVIKNEELEETFVRFCIYGANYGDFSWFVGPKRSKQYPFFPDVNDVHNIECMNVSDPKFTFLFQPHNYIYNKNNNYLEVCSIKLGKILSIKKIENSCEILKLHLINVHELHEV